MKTLYWLTDPTSPHEMALNMQQLRDCGVPVVRFTPSFQMEGSRLHKIYLNRISNVRTPDKLIIREQDIALVKLIVGGHFITEIKSSL